MGRRENTSRIFVSDQDHYALEKLYRDLAIAIDYYEEIPEFGNIDESFRLLQDLKEMVYEDLQAVNVEMYGEEQNYNY